MRCAHRSRRLRLGGVEVGRVALGSQKGVESEGDDVAVKDLVESGGAWISSVELETAIASPPDVVEAAAIARPDPRWTERPVAYVARCEGSATGAEDLEATAQKAPDPLRTELRAASKAFARAQNPRYGRKSVLLTHCAARPATSSTPPAAPTAMQWPPGRSLRLDDHRGRALARSEAPRPPGRSCPPGRPAPADGRRPSTCSDARRTHSPTAQGSSPPRAGQRYTSSSP
ncbi:hypothetical protein EJC51_00880 [Streptomyces aquilus]|uniref:AMP-binding enzyme C-terminal domain-containing protein n=1 Tax=Streptomyces aquilus TaxID=2548456 RepID=A0A3Q9BUQ2_9ACTN|nr:hypothetical protein EJC51_00880 [Streptomyces aquilus]